MHPRHNFAVNLRLHGRAGIEGRIQHVQNLFGHHPGIGAGFAHDLPQRSLETVSVAVH